MLWKISINKRLPALPCKLYGAPALPKNRSQPKKCGTRVASNLNVFNLLPKPLNTKPQKGYKLLRRTNCAPQ